MMEVVWLWELSNEGCMAPLLMQDRAHRYRGCELNWFHRVVALDILSATDVSTCKETFAA